MADERDMNTTDEEPLACDLEAIESDERDEHRRAAASVFGAVRSLHELPDGYALELKDDTGLIEQAGAFIARERLCCPFFHFALEVEPGGGPVRLEITGREGVKSYIEHNLIPELNVQRREG